MCRNIHSTEPSYSLLCCQSFITPLALSQTSFGSRVGRLVHTCMHDAWFLINWLLSSSLFNNGLVYRKHVLWRTSNLMIHRWMHELSPLKSIVFEMIDLQGFIHICTSPFDAAWIISCKSVQPLWIKFSSISMHLFCYNWGSVTKFYSVQSCLLWSWAEQSEPWSTTLVGVWMKQRCPFFLCQWRGGVVPPSIGKSYWQGAPQCAHPNDRQVKATGADISADSSQWNILFWDVSWMGSTGSTGEHRILFPMTVLVSARYGAVGTLLMPEGWTTVNRL